MKKYFLKHLLLILTIFIFVIANTSAQTVKKWTFLVYMAADNDLEQFLLNDITEMVGIGSSDSVNIVLEIDRAEQYSDAWGDFTDTRRYLVTQHGSLGELLPVEVIGETNTGDPQNLVNFITWGIQNYPAEKYSLIISSHGGGWQGIGPDYSANNDGILSLAEINSALTTARAQTGIAQFEFIGFDACLMGQLEVYQTLQGHAKYALAAEEVIPGNGYDYTATLAYLVNNPDTSTEDLLSVIIDSYMDFYAKFGKAYQSYDLHAIDLVALEGVNSALADFITVANANMTDIFSPIGASRVGAQFFSYATDKEFVDLIDLMTLIEQGTESPEVQASALAVIDAVVGSVLYTRTTDTMPSANGISIYFPILADTFTKEAYIASGISPLMAQDWIGFLDTFHTTASRILADNNITITVTDVLQVGEVVNVLNPPIINFETTGTAIIDLQYVAFYQTESGQVIVAQSPLAIYSEDADGNLRSTYPDGDYQSSYAWDVLMSYMDIEGAPIPVLLEYQTRSSQFKMSGVFCWIEYAECTQAKMFFDGITYEMLTVWVTIETENGTVTAQVTPQAGDTFNPALAILTPEGNIETATLPNSIVFADGVMPKFYYGPAATGTYVVTLLIRDLTGAFRADNALITVNNNDLPNDLRGFPDALVLGVNFAYPITWGDSVIQNLETNTRYYIGNEDGSFFINLEQYDATSLEDFSATVMPFFEQTISFATDPFTFTTATGYTGIAIEYAFGETGYGYYLMFYENGIGYLFDLYMPNGYDETIMTAIYGGFDGTVTFFAPME
ncbi:MAG: clostripain-related cysteine peptidase [Phototrophicales bacterium]|nr:clostripain-related cysteine peptidase [Phototrophicales bacterium]